MISCLDGTSGSETSEGDDDMFVLDSEDEEDQDLSDKEGVNLVEIDKSLYIGFIDIQNKAIESALCSN